jgi:DNA helicase HerA-like ATPase
MSAEDLRRLIEGCEWIGTVSSPSSTTSLRVDLMEGAVDRNLVGASIVVLFVQDGKPTLLLGQVTDINLSNPYVERHSIRKITSVKGSAPPLTERHDVRTMEILPGSAFTLEAGTLLPVSLGTVPSTGTKVYLFGPEVMRRLISGQPNIGYLGEIYGSRGVPLPMYFMHFGKGSGGLGEGYHIGIFGKTGSGKSFLARMVITLYAKNPSMSILIIDPVGEYSKDIRNSEHMGPVLRGMGRAVEAYEFTNLVFSDVETFLRMLDRTRFYEELGIPRPENKENAREVLRRLLEDPNQPGRIRPTLGGSIYGPQQINTEDGFSLVLNEIKTHITDIYVRDEEARRRVMNNIQNKGRILFSIWQPIADLFSPSSNKKRVEDLLDEVCPSDESVGRKIVAIDLSEVSRFFDPEGATVLLNEIFRKLETMASERYHRGLPLINLLVVVDEAHRFVPSGRVEDEDVANLKMTLTRAANETRKFGLGWMFISTSIAGLEPEVLKPMRIYFFGYGLCWGTELRALRDLLGDERCIDLYRTFRDPATLIAMGGKEYPFMVYGPVSPFSASGAPLFFRALDYDSEFRQANQL